MSASPLAARALQANPLAILSTMQTPTVRVDES
jgi:hypothetical protein